MADFLVSIIIPLYNKEHYIAQCIESAIAQTWSHKEIIIVDDGSTDNSLTIAKQYECSWIQILHQEKRGASAARNRGLDKAQGEYIQFLDADDLLSIDKIELQARALSKYLNKVAVCSTVHFYADEDPAGKSPSPYEEAFLFDDDAPAHFLTNLWGGYSDRGSMVAVHAWLTPRSLIEKVGRWDERITVDDDGEYFCRVILASEGILKTNGYCYYRKYHTPNSLSPLNNYDSIKSLLTSTLSKKEHLLKQSHQQEAELAIYKILMDVRLTAYLKYPDIYVAASKALPQITRPSYHPVMGGPIMNLLSKTFGWKVPVLLKHLYSKIRKAG